MKKLPLRVIAGCAALSLLLCFAACKKETPVSGTTAPESSAQAQSTVMAATTAPTTALQSTKPSAVSTTAASKKAWSKAEIIALYNQSVGQMKKRTSFSRTMDSGTLWSPGNFDGATIDLTENKDALSIFNISDRNAKSAALPKLSEGSVASAQCREEGAKRILTIRLKPQGGGKTIETDAAAYTGLITYDEGASLAKKLAKSYNKLFSISVKNIDFSLSDGVITATLSATDNTPSSIRLSFEQSLDLEGKFIAYEVKSKIACHIQAEYSK